MARYFRNRTLTPQHYKDLTKLSGDPFRFPLAGTLGIWTDNLEPEIIFSDSRAGVGDVAQPAALFLRQSRDLFLSRSVFSSRGLFLGLPRASIRDNCLMRAGSGYCCPDTEPSG